MGVLDKLLSIWGVNPERTASRVHARPTHSGTSQLQSFWGYLQTYPDQDRVLRYRDYDAMNAYADISKALEIYASESTQRSPETDRVVSVGSKYKDVEETLYDFLDNVMNIEVMIFGLARNLAQYGDYFAYLNIEGNKGITDVQWFHPVTVSVELDPETLDFSGWRCNVAARGYFSSEFAQMIPPKGSLGREIFDPYEFIHFKTPGADLNSPYGRSMLEAGRFAWKSLEMLETALAIYRLHRAGTQRIYYIDVGTQTPGEARETVESWKRSLKTKHYLQVDQQNNILGEKAHNTTFSEMLSKYNPMDLLDDIFWPVKQDSKSSVQNVSNDVDVRAVADVDHFKAKLRAALGIPKAYLDGEINGWNASQALAQQDIQFAKSIDRLQRSVLHGLEQLCRVHLYLLGYDEDVPFEITIPLGSDLLQLQRLQVLDQKYKIANGMIGMSTAFGLAPKKWSRWLLRNVMGFSQSFVQRYQTEEPQPTLMLAKGAEGAEETGPAAAVGMDDAEAKQSKVKKAVAENLAKLRKSPTQPVFVEHGFLITDDEDENHEWED